MVNHNVTMRKKGGKIFKYRIHENFFQVFFYDFYKTTKSKFIWSWQIIWEITEKEWNKFFMDWQNNLLKKWIAM